MSNIDNRVVKLTFDNAQFERNASTSFKTIEKLKSMLDFKGSTKGLESLQMQIQDTKFDSMVNGVQNIAKQFDFLHIVGRRTIENLTTSFMNFASSSLAAVSETIAGGGKKRAMDIENARFTLQGLISDQAEVNAIMDDAKNSVDGTAYAYNSAASAASQLAASGIRSGEEMQTVLKGIAGIAATTNTDYDEIAHIFTTIAGNGRIMTEQLNQFSYRGMNAAATLTNAFNDVLHGSSTLSSEFQDHIKAAVEFGMSEVEDFGGSLEGITEGDLRKLVTKGAISFDMFAGIMAATFGDHAKDANKTFTGSMANIQSALARTGEMFYKDLIVQEGPLVNLFNKVREAVNDLNKVLWPFATIWNELVISMAEGATKIIDAFLQSGGFSKLENVFGDIGHDLRQVFKIINEVIFGIDNSLDPLTNLRDLFFNSSEFSTDGFIGVILDAIEKLHEALSFSEDDWASFKKIVQSAKNVLEGIGNILGGVIDVLGAFFRELFGMSVFEDFPTTLLNATEAFKNLTEVIKPNQEQIEKLSNFFKGFFDIVELVAYVVSTVLKGAFDTIGRIFGIVAGEGDPLYDVLSNIGDILQIVAGVIKNLFDRISSNINLDPIINRIKEFVDSAKGFYDLDSIGDRYHTFIEGLKESVSSGNIPGLDFIIDKIKILKDIVSEYLPNVSDIFDRYKESVTQSLVAAKDKLLEFIDALKGSFKSDGMSISDFFERIKNFVDGLKESLENAVPIIKSKIDEIRGTLANLTKGTAGEVGKYEGLDIVGALGLTGGIVAIKKIIDKIKELKDGTDSTGIKESLSEIKDAVVDTFGEIQNTLKVGSIIGISVAIGIFAASLYAVSKIPTENLLGSVAAISVFIMEMRGMLSKFEDMDSVDVGQMLGVTLSLVLFAYSVYELAKAVEVIGNLDMKNILQGLLTISILIAEMVAVSKVLSKDSGMMLSSGLALIGMAVAIRMLVKPIEDLSNMDPDKLKQGLLAISAVLVVLGGSAALAGAGNFGISAGIGIIALASSLFVMYQAVNLFSGMDWDVFTNGIIKVGIALGILTASAFFTGLGGFGISAGIGMTALATSLFVMYAAIKLYSDINWDFTQGIINLGIALAVFTASAAVLGMSGFGISAGAGMLAMGVGIMAMSAGIAMLAGLPVLAVVASLAILVVGLLAFGAVGYVLAPVAPVLMSVAIAVGIFGLSALAMSVGLLALVIALGAFGGAIIGFLETASSLIDPLIQAMINFMNSAAEGIRNNQDSFIDALGNMLLAIGELLVNAVTTFAEFVVNWFQTEAWPWIQENGPKIVQGLIDGIMGMLGNLGQAAYDLWNGFVEELKKGIDEIFNAGAQFVQGFMDGLASMPGDIANAAANIGSEALGALQGFLGIQSPSKKARESGTWFTQGFIDGIGSLKKQAVTETESLASSVLGALSPDLETDYQPSVTPVLDLTNIQNGIGIMDGMFESMSGILGINSSIDAKTSLSQQAMQALSAGSDYSSILNGMLGLREDLAKYNEIMSKLQIVMDTGTMVGQLTPGIDRQLGRNAMLAGRGVV